MFMPLQVIFAPQSENDLQETESTTLPQAMTGFRASDIEEKSHDQPAPGRR
jgi:hypothetical protein